MSDRECIKHGEDIILSTEDMNSCSGAGSCNGGYPAGAYNYWKRTGVVREQCVKYSLPSCDHHIPHSDNPCKGKIVPTPACKKTCVDDPSIDFEKDKRKAEDVYTVRGEENMMVELSTNGPCEGAFSVYEDFLLYTGGIYKHTSGSYEGGHAIRILGYGVENGTKYWLIANSWNEHWGEKGYFRIVRGTNECGIENTMWCGIAE
jgi:cathepsin B